MRSRDEEKCEAVLRKSIREDGLWCHVVMCRVLARRDAATWVEAMQVGLGNALTKRGLTLADTVNCIATALMVVMMGGEVDCAVVPAISLTGTPGVCVAEKRLAYLFCAVSIPPGDERLLLLANQILKDLGSPDPLIILAALSASAKLICEETFTVLIQAVWSLSQHKHHLVRRKATTTLLGFYRGAGGKHVLSIVFKKPSEVFISTLAAVSVNNFLASFALCRALVEGAKVRMVGDESDVDGDICVLTPLELEAMLIRVLAIAEEMLQHHGIFSEATKPTVFMQIEVVRCVGLLARLAPPTVLADHVDTVFSLLGGLVRRARGRLIPAAFDTPVQQSTAKLFPPSDTSSATTSPAHSEKPRRASSPTTFSALGLRLTDMKERVKGAVSTIVASSPPASPHTFTAMDEPQHNGRNTMHSHGVGVPATSSAFEGFGGGGEEEGPTKGFFSGLVSFARSEDKKKVEVESGATLPSRTDMEAAAVVLQVVKTLATASPLLLQVLKEARSDGEVDTACLSAPPSQQGFLNKVLRGTKEAAPTGTTQARTSAAHILKTCSDVVGFLQPFFPSESAETDEACQWKESQGNLSEARYLGFSNARRVRGDVFYTALRLTAFLSLVDQKEGMAQQALVVRALSSVDATLFLAGVDTMCSLARTDNVKPVTKMLLKYASSPPEGIRNFSIRDALRTAVITRLHLVAWDVVRPSSRVLFLYTTLAILRQFQDMLAAAELALRGAGAVSASRFAAGFHQNFLGWLHSELCLVEGETILGHHDLELTYDDSDSEGASTPAARAAKIHSRHSFRDSVCDIMLEVVNGGLSTVQRLTTRQVPGFNDPSLAPPDALRPAVWVLGEFGLWHGSANLNTLFDALLDRLYVATTDSPVSVSGALLALAKLFIMYTHLRLSGQPVMLNGSVAGELQKDTGLRKDVLAAYVVCLQRKCVARDLVVAGAAQMSLGLTQMSSSALEMKSRGEGSDVAAGLFEELALPYATTVQADVDKRLGFLDSFVSSLAAEREALGFTMKAYQTPAERAAVVDAAAQRELQAELQTLAEADVLNEVAMEGEELSLNKPAVRGPWGRGGYEAMDTAQEVGTELDSPALAPSVPVAERAAKRKKSKRKKAYAWLDSAMDAADSNRHVAQKAEESPAEEALSVDPVGLQGESMGTYWGSKAQPKPHLWGMLCFLSLVFVYSYPISSVKELT